MRRVQWLLTLAVCSLLTQCVISNTDPGYAELEKSAARNPSPSAIHGMWHRLDHRAALRNSTTSLLFHPNGTVEYVGHNKLFGLTPSSDIHGKLRYHYAGNGVWKVVGSSEEFRISGSRLLMYKPIPELYDYIRYVLVRVE